MTPFDVYTRKVFAMATTRVSLPRMSKMETVLLCQSSPLWIRAILAGSKGIKAAAWHPVTGTDWHSGDPSSEGQIKLSLENT
ncbi:hypothetical protein JZ751_021744 [Albula glossodonta]|uniref:Uncharacterized protein n=1 Tax=Albula glossodonta TaxID=121402 RepID=A0A8T2NV91_9TELE|nr:hypothetical protein JZ751_021744 [Albula glossodonta]